MKSEVEKRLSEFRKVRKIGEGTYGEVHEALDTANNNRKVAMKKLHIDNKDEGIPITALREMCILKHLHHENVVDLYEIIQDVDKIVLIFEYADMDLKKYLDKVKGGRKNVKITLSTDVSSSCPGTQQALKDFSLKQNWGSSKSLSC